MKTKTQVEKELQKFIAKYLPAGKLSVGEVKQWVFEENGAPLGSAHAFQDKVMQHFSGTKADINEMLQISMDAWNYFPHESLGGKSPDEMVKDYKAK